MSTPPESDARQNEQKGEEYYDVIVIGGGLAGLLAARNIKRRAKQLKVLVLEATDKVGGRTHTSILRTNNGGTDQWDLGGQWVGQTQRHVIQLMDDLKLELYDQYSKGTKLAQIGETEIRTYEDSLPTNSSLLQYSLSEALDFIRFFTETESMTQRVPIKNPFEDPQASEWDGMTMAEFVRRKAFTRTIIDSAESLTRSVYGTTPSKISLLYHLAYANGAGSESNLLEAVGDGAQRYRIKGGSQQMSVMMADDLNNENDGTDGNSSVKLESPVIRIQNMSDSAIVWCLQTEKNPIVKVVKYKCQKVVMAIPPQQCCGVQFEPALPEYRAQLHAAMPLGNLLKFVITYPRAFWRDKGLSGEIVASGFTDIPGQILPTSITFDGVTSSGSPAIVGFYNTEWADKPVDQRKDNLIKDLAKFFGPEALEYIDYADRDWSKIPYTGGCPAGVLPPGYMHCMMRIREPIGRIHWAGTETASVWPGYMDGAIQSGLRASGEVLMDLIRGIQIPKEELDGSQYSPDHVAPKPRDQSYHRSRRASTIRNVGIGLTVVGLAMYWADRNGYIKLPDVVDFKSRMIEIVKFK